MLNARSATITDPNSEHNASTASARAMPTFENITQGGSGRSPFAVLLVPEAFRLPSFVSSLIDSRVSHRPARQKSTVRGRV